MGLAWRERDEVSTVRSELSQEAGRLLDVDQGVVGKDVEEEASGGADVPAVTVATEAGTGRRSSEKFPGQKPEGHVLRRDLPRDEVLEDVAEACLGIGHSGSLFRRHFKHRKTNFKQERIESK